MNKVRQALLLTVLLLLFCACEKQPAEDIAVSKPAVDPNGQLFCLAEDQAQAEKVAALYGISLVEFGAGMAVFYTEEDPGTVIEKGLANGWPELSLNSIDSFA